VKIQSAIEREIRSCRAERCAKRCAPRGDAQDRWIKRGAEGCRGAPRQKRRL